MLSADSPTIYKVLSRGSVRIPAADLLVDGELSVNPALDQKGYFTVHFKGRDLELAATGYCGFIPVNSKVAVEVQPKMPVTNLGRIFDVAGLSLPKIDGLQRQYDSASDASAPMLEFLAGEYATALAAVVDHGLKKSYLPRRVNNTHPRGRIEFQETIRSNFARGRPDKIVSNQSEQRIDIPENRLLRAAGELLLTRLRRYRNGWFKIQQGLGPLLSYFSGVSQISPSDMRWLKGQQSLHSGAADVRVASLHQALGLAQIILEENEVEVGSIGRAVDLSAVVVDFDKLFEAYVRNALVVERLRLGLEFVILDGNKGGKKSLFDNRLNPPAQPDIVLKGSDGSPRLLLEVKYKSWPDRSDYNQAITYAASYKVSVIVLVHQASKREDAGLSEVGRVGSITIMRYGILLDAASLEDEERAFSAAIFNLIPGGRDRVAV